MPQERSGYGLCFEKLGHGDEPFGGVALVPWDSDIFGFPVAQYHVGSERIEESQTGVFRDRLLSWLLGNGVVLCSCAIPASNGFWKACLPLIGFQFVDLGLQVVLNSLQKARLQDARCELRPAQRDDWEAVEAIAEAAFHHGRYHADPRFPRELADRRYRRWVAKALAGVNPSERIYVMGEPGRVQGFHHLTVDGTTADLRLAAVAPEVQGTLLGFDLYLAVLRTLKNSGVRRVVSSISAANTAVMNAYSLLGFHFAEPEAIYHWHWPAAHLRAT